MAYIKAHWNDQPMWGGPYRNGYWGDSLMQADESMQALWLDETQDGRWLHGGPDLVTTLGY